MQPVNKYDNPGRQTRYPDGRKQETPPFEPMHTKADRWRAQRPALHQVLNLEGPAPSGPLSGNPFLQSARFGLLRPAETGFG